MNKVGKHQHKSTPGTATVHSASWSGPLPPPAALEHFDRVSPGAAKLIINHMIAEGEHRREMEKRSLALDHVEIEGQHRLLARGQWFGLILGVLMIGGGIAAMLVGRDVTGFGSVLIGGAALIASMWFGRKPTT